MTEATQNGLLEEYASVLDEYLQHGQEAAFQRAYELGRRAMNQGLGVVEFAALHQHALAGALLPHVPAAHGVGTIRAAEFFADALSPFEMAFRGFEEANVTLRGLNETLEEQVAERTEALRKNHAILAAVTEGTTDAVFVKDREGRYLMINSAGAGFLGKRVEEVIGKVDTELFSRETAEQIMADDRSVMDSGQTQTFEERGTADGVTRTYLSTKGPYRDAHGNVIGVIGISRDISQRKQAEQALRESEQRFARFMQHLPGLAWIKDLEGRYVYANDATANAFHTSHADLYGKTDDEVFDEATAAEFQASDRRALASRAGILTEETLEQENGMVHHSVVSKFPIFDAEDQPILVGGMAIDITDRRRAEEQLRRSEQELADFFDNATLGLHWVGPDGTIRRANRAELEMLGYSADEYLGRHIAEFHVERELINEVMRCLHAGEEVHNFEARLRCKDGSIKHVLIDSNVLWEDGRFIHTRCFTRDITEQKRAEEQLRQLNENLEQRVRERTKHIQLLQDVAIIANEAVSIDQAFQASLERICRFTGWPVGHAYICANDDPRTLVTSSVWYLGDADRFAEFRSVTEAKPVRPERGLPGRALASGKPVWIADLAEDTQFLRTEAARAVGLRAGFAFPVLVGKEVATVLEFFALETAAPDEETSAMMANVGTQLGRVIERSRAEAALRRSEQYYRSLIEHAQDMITVLDGEGTILYQSPAAERILGYRPADLVGRNVFELVHPDDLRRVRTAFLEGVRDSRTPRSAEFRCRHVNGSWRVFESIGVSYLDQPEVAAVIVNSRDVTQRKQAEDALRNREKQLAHAQKLASLGSWEWDVASDRVTWSEELYRIFGLQPGQFGGTFTAFLDLVHPEDRDRVRSAIETGLRTASPFSFDERIVRRDGAIRILRSQGEVFTDETGRAVRMFGTCQDVTEAKLREETLRISELRFRSVWENSADGMRLSDEQGRIVAVNDAYCRLVGRPAGELVGEPFTVAYTVADEEQLQRKYQTRFDQCVIERHFERPVTFRSGMQVDLLVTNSFVEWQPKTRLLLSIFRDISELKQAQKRAVRAERLAAIGEMIAGISHESRNALQRSQACLERLAWRVEDRPEAAELVCRIRHALGDLHRTYDEVRQYAAPVNLKRARCHLGALIEETWEELAEARFERDARLCRLATPLDLHCEVDAFAIKQVFRNMLENSLSACSDPLQIDVGFCESDLDAVPALAIAIRDNGPGLTPEQRQRIFEPFYTTKTRGTGLGMAIAKRVIEAHEGHIAVGRGAGRGAEIRITLPRRAR